MCSRIYVFTNTCTQSAKCFYATFRSIHLSPLSCNCQFLSLCPVAIQLDRVSDSKPLSCLPNNHQNNELATRSSHPNGGINLENYTGLTHRLGNIKPSTNSGFQVPDLLVHQDQESLLCYWRAAGSDSMFLSEHLFTAGTGQERSDFKAAIF